MSELEIAESFDHTVESTEHKNLLEDLFGIGEVEKAPSMEIQVKEIAETFFEIPELQFETWKEMSAVERVETLQSFEAEVAKIECREASIIKSEDLGDTCNGMFSGATRDISINSRLLESNSEKDYKQVLETFFHEGRHAYQYHNLYVEQTEQNSVMVETWHINEHILGYNSGDYGLFGYEEYYTQPVEADANIFADEAMRQLDLR